MVRMTCYAAEPVDDIAGIRGKAEVDEVAWLTSGDRGRCAPAAAQLLERLHDMGHIK
jgi:hypothetical protein